MIAAKAFDPVLGVDIHIIQPPGPVPPVPVPHPFVGMLIDPMDFAPIIGATVMVNGMPRATAGTGGKCIPPHIPIGGVFVKPPANECEVFMGSSTVLADDDPLSFLGMPVLSCHDVGMVAPFRLKKKRKTKSLVLPTSVLLSVPAGAPVLVGGPPTISMMAMGMKAAMAGLGKAFRKLRKLQKGSRRMKALSKKVHGAAKKAMDKLGVPPNVQNRVHRAVCSVTGHPVDIATGKVFTEAVDFELPGPIPFRWERVWYSCSTYDGPLGHGWHHCYDMALMEEEGAVAVRLEDGRSAAFPALSVGEHHFDRAQRLTLLRDRAGHALRDGSGLLYRFGPIRHGAIEEKLLSVEDANGNRLALRHDPHGRLAEIIDSAGRRLTIEWSTDDRIVGIIAPHPDHAGRALRVVSYAYDAAGNLTEVRDAAGYAARFEYRDHLLVRETDRLGISFNFAYESVGTHARCVRTWGDGGLLARTLTYDDVAQRTSVVDTRGATSVHYWNDRGLVVREIDTAGHRRMWEYDDDGYKVAQTDELGRVRQLAWDAAGRITRAQSADGTAREFAYDVDGHLTRMVDEGGGEWRRTVDARGNVTSVTDPLGARTEYVVGERGFPARIIDPTGGETRFGWDASGNIVQIADRTGATTLATYDGHGRLVRRQDAEGGELRFRRDLLGRIMAIADKGGRQSRFEYDAEGNVVATADAAGRARVFDFGPFAPGGRLVRIRERAGAESRFRYDMEGDLAQVVDPAGRTWEFGRDQLGNVVAETDFLGRTLQYEYDAARQLVARTDAAGLRSTFERDAAGRLVRRVLPNGEAESFAYDAQGRITSATNDAAEVTWTYDARGRVLEERQNGRVVRSTYDAQGRRRERRSPSGRTIAFDYDAEGRLRHMSDPEGWFLEMDYDRLGREVLRRAPSDVVSTRAYAADALTEQSTSRAGTTLLRRRYRYESSGLLEETDDTTFGLTQYRHDATGRLSEVLYPEGRLERFLYDGAGNASAAPMRLGVPDRVRPSAGSDEAGNREPPREPGDHTVHHADRWTLRYDANGNLTSKESEGDVWRYRYDAAGRLAEVARNGASITRFAYDAVGRRVLKTTASRTTRYTWDGDTVVEEAIDPGGGRPAIRDYVFRGFTPLAMFRDGDVVTFECDQIGAPRLAIDKAGAVVWEGRLSGFGELIEETGSIDIDLRFPGQHFDSETGLVYNRLRYYDPSLRIYTQPDPVKLLGGMAQYNYVPSPTRWMDPYGLDAEWVDPDDVNFTQRTISDNNYQKAMEADDWDWDRSGPLRVTEVDGQLVSYDNRRLDAARGAQNVDSVPIHRVDPDSVIEEWDPVDKKFKPMPGAKKTWQQAFDGRRNDPRNKAAGGAVPEKGLKDRPRKVCK